MLRALLVFTLFSSGISAAQAVLLDRVVMLVDGEPILRSEVLERMQMETPAPDTVEARTQVYADALEGLITEKLVRSDAKRLRIEPEPEDVSRALVAIAQANKIAVDEVLAEVRKRGITEASYRRIVAQQLLDQRWLYTRLVGTLSELTPEQAAAERAKFVGQLRERAVIEVVQ